MLRFIENVSATPEWAQNTKAAELVIAQIMGSWQEGSEQDKKVAEELSGKAYGEWITTIREISSGLEAPLTHWEGAWKFTLRYEGWFELAPRLYDEHLDRIQEISVKVLTEIDPQFELPTDQRFAANLYGKTLAHSTSLRHGLAETLAMIGSYPEALTSCSSFKAKSIAHTIVKEILFDADGLLWASLDRLLPLLAEASPDGFLESIENALQNPNDPFNTVFAQEDAPITGGTYISGLLWGLETLAWSPSYLSQVILILGRLADKDPGGRWSNRPSESLKTILMPWIPQTCASVQQRINAAKDLMNEFPDVAWELILKLLPGAHQSSSGTRQPVWREMIPENWPDRPTNIEYRDQVLAYIDIAIECAKQDIDKLAELVDRLHHLPEQARTQLLKHLESDEVIGLPEKVRLKLWNELMTFVGTHRKYSDADWTLPSEVLDEMMLVVDKIKPTSPLNLHQRLFNERAFDLYEDRGDWEEQRKALDTKRKAAIQEVYEHSGFDGVIEFSQSVTQPWTVGYLFSDFSSIDEEKNVLPIFLNAEEEYLSQFAGGYIGGKLQLSGYEWVDSLDMSTWSSDQKGQFLAYLPFSQDTWSRTTTILPDDESFYWSKANVNPYGNVEQGLESAIGSLIKFERPLDAIRCLDQMIHKEKPFQGDLAVRALKGVLKLSSNFSHNTVHDVVEVIKALQDHADISPKDISEIEWLFLPLLDGTHDAYPKQLEHQLASDPSFFGTVLRTVFKSKNEDERDRELTEQQQLIAKNAYRLLDNWKVVPGVEEDGTVNEDQLNQWLEAVIEESKETGHEDMALNVIGKVLLHSPADPDGLWIHKTIAKILDERAFKRMRQGFTIAMVNSRGVYYGSSGKEEFKLAEKYLDQSQQLLEHGFPNLAEAVKRDVSDSYRQEAEREVSRKQFEYDN